MTWQPCVSILDLYLFGSDTNTLPYRCYDPNLVLIPVEVETPDHHYYRVSDICQLILISVSKELVFFSYVND
jgi:hypothetical protein